MRFTKTDDPIRGIGFVAIYFANLEDILDELIGLSGNIFIRPDKIERCKFRDKAEWLQKQFRTAFRDYPYDDSEEEGAHVDKILGACRTAALKRNDIVHRPIFGDMKGGALRKAPSGAMKRLDVVGIYRFAEHVHDLASEVWGLRFAVGRLWKARGSIRHSPTTNLKTNEQG